MDTVKDVRSQPTRKDLKLRRRAHRRRINEVLRRASRHQTFEDLGLRLERFKRGAR